MRNQASPHGDPTMGVDGTEDTVMSNTVERDHSKIACPGGTTLRQANCDRTGYAQGQHPRSFVHLLLRDYWSAGPDQAPSARARPVLRLHPARATGRPEPDFSEPERRNEPSAVQHMGGNHQSLLQPGCGQLPVLRRTRHHSLRRMARGSLGVHCLHRARARPETVPAAFNRPDKQHARVRAGEHSLGYSERAGAEPEAPHPHLNPVP